MIMTDYRHLGIWIALGGGLQSKSQQIPHMGYSFTDYHNDYHQI
jgi:hypothetical protein